MNPIEETAERAAQLRDEDADSVRSLFERLGPHADRHARSGNLAAASGVVSLLRAVRTLRKGDRKRGIVQAASGLFWLGVATTQRRSGSRSGDVDQSDVAATSVELDDVDAGTSDTDHRTGDEVVDTTDADLDETDTKPELDSDVDDADVDQTDVVDGGDVESVSEETDDEADEQETATDEETDEADEQDEATAEAVTDGEGESDEE